MGMEKNLCFIARIIGLGRITIPEPVRVALNLKVGDIVEIEVKKKVVAEAPLV